MGASQSRLRLVAPVREPADAGEPLDFDGVFRRYAPYVAAIGLRLLGAADEVDELVQDVFLDAHRTFGTLRDRGAVRGWLAAIAVRKAQRRLRRRRLRAWLGMTIPIAYGDAIDPGATPQDRLLLGSVYRVLDRLPAEQRIAWTLRYVEGEQLETVATLCDCSLATAKRRIAAAHAKVEEVLRDA